MGTPHKHAELIKAWADGAEIQYRFHSNAPWVDKEKPVWDLGNEYRIKPKTIRYRNYLWQDPYYKDTKHVGIAREQSTEHQNNFVKWLGDWIEVEV